MFCDLFIFLYFLPLLSVVHHKSLLYDYEEEEEDEVDFEEDVEDGNVEAYVPPKKQRLDQRRRDVIYDDTDDESDEEEDEVDFLKSNASINVVEM
jgi:hypothetical protein